MVTWDPGGACVFGPGLWFTTVPAGWVDVASGLTETVKPSFCRIDAASLSDLPCTLGTGTGAAALDTYRVTTVSAATLLPSAGFDLMTSPFLTLELGWLTMFPSFRCALVISDFAWLTDSPFTSGTAYVLPPPASR